MEPGSLHRRRTRAQLDCEMASAQTQLKALRPQILQRRRQIEALKPAYAAELQAAQQPRRVECANDVLSAVAALQRCLAELDASADEIAAVGGMVSRVMTPPFLDAVVEAAKSIAANG
jgi:uncharacterized protein involved in exopolysaccharide biosynthesis